MIRIILNGKKAGLEEIRAAVATLRGNSVDVEVRVTWEHGDAERLVHEAAHDGIQRLVAAGGDGTLNEEVIQEVLNPSLPGKYVKRFRSPWVESWPHQTRSVNLDGEPYQADHIRFESLPGEIRLVLPDNCP